MMGYTDFTLPSKIGLPLNGRSVRINFYLHIQTVQKPEDG